VSIRFHSVHACRFSPLGLCNTAAAATGVLTTPATKPPLTPGIMLCCQHVSIGY
jgi:hypothetical protein